MPQGLPAYQEDEQGNIVFTNPEQVDTKDEDENESAFSRLFKLGKIGSEFVAKAQEGSVEGLFRGFVGAVDAVTEKQKEGMNFISESLGLGESIPPGSSQDIMLTEANRVGATVVATTALSALLRDPKLAAKGGADIAVPVLERVTTSLAELAGAGGVKEITLRQLATKEVAIRQAANAATLTAPGAISAMFGEPENERGAAAEVGASIGTVLGQWAGTIASAPGPAKPFAFLFSLLGKNPSMAKAVGGVAGASFGAVQAMGGWEEVHGWQDNLKLGMMVGLPGVFQLTKAHQADNMLKAYGGPSAENFEDVLAKADSQSGAAHRLFNRYKALTTGENVEADDLARMAYVRTIGKEDARYIDVMNRLNPIRAGSAFFSSEIMDDPDLMHALVKASGGEEGPIGRALAKRTQDQIGVLFGYDFSEEGEKALQGLLPSIARYGDPGTLRLLRESGLMDFPSKGPAQATNMLAGIETQEAMKRTIERVTNLKPAKFAELITGIELAGKKAITSEAKERLASMRLPTDITDVLQRDIETQFGQRLTPLLDSLKDEYIRKTIIGKAAIPVMHQADEVAEKADDIIQGAWRFDGAAMHDNVVRNADAIKAIYGEKGYNGLRDLSTIVSFHQRVEAQIPVEGVIKSARRNMSFMTHRLMFTFASGNLTGTGGGLKGMLLGMGAMKGGSEAVAHGIGLARMSKFAVQNPEMIQELRRATLAGDEVKEHAITRAILGKFIGAGEDTEHEDY